MIYLKALQFFVNDMTNMSVLHTPDIQGRANTLAVAMCLVDIMVKELQHVMMQVPVNLCDGFLPAVESMKTQYDQLVEEHFPNGQK